jgi:hypothetical protein
LTGAGAGGKDADGGPCNMHTLRVEAAVDKSRTSFSCVVDAEEEPLDGAVKSCMGGNASMRVNYDNKGKVWR